MISKKCFLLFSVVLLSSFVGSAEAKGIPIFLFSGYGIGLTIAGIVGESIALISLPSITHCNFSSDRLLHLVPVRCRLHEGRQRGAHGRVTTKIVYVPHYIDMQYI